MLVFKLCFPRYILIFRTIITNREKRKRKKRKEREREREREGGGNLKYIFSVFKQWRRRLKLEKVRKGLKWHTTVQQRIQENYHVCSWSWRLQLSFALETSSGKSVHQGTLLQQVHCQQVMKTLWQGHPQWWIRLHWKMWHESQQESPLTMVFIPLLLKPVKPRKLTPLLP